MAARPGQQRAGGVLRGVPRHVPAHEVPVTGAFAVGSLAEDRVRDVAGMQVGKLRDLGGAPRAAFALLGRGMAGVPHEVVGDELLPPLERVQQGERPLQPDQREAGVDLDHGQAPPGRGDRVAFPGVRLLPDPQLRRPRPGTWPGRVTAGAPGLVLVMTLPLLLLSCSSRGRLRRAVDRGQAPVPLGGERHHGPGGLIEAAGFHLVENFPALLAPADQPGSLEHDQMLGDRLAGERHPSGQPAGAHRAVADQEVEDPAARRVGDRRPQLVVGLRSHYGCCFASNVARRSGNSPQPPLCSSA